MAALIHMYLIPLKYTKIENLVNYVHKKQLFSNKLTSLPLLDR